MINLNNAEMIIGKALKVDLDDIVKRQPKIPALDKGYTKEDLQKWIDVRVAKLRELATKPALELSVERATVLSKVPPTLHILSADILENKIDQGELELTWEDLIQQRLIQITDV